MIIHCQKKTKLKPKLYQLNLGDSVIIAYSKNRYPHIKFNSKIIRARGRDQQTQKLTHFFTGDIFFYAVGPVVPPPPTKTIDHKWS